MQVDDKLVETTYKFLTSHIKSALLLIIIPDARHRDGYVVDRPLIRELQGAKPPLAALANISVPRCPFLAVP